MRGTAPTATIAAMVDSAEVTTKTPATYEDVLAAPEDRVAELIDGTLYTHARPRLIHARIAMALSRATAELEHGQGSIGGWSFVTEPELHAGRDVLVPDLAAWRIARFPAAQLHTAAITVMPDWVGEILSPSTARLDHVLKLPRYAAAGVDWAWLVDPTGRTIEVLARDGLRWIVEGAFGMEPTARGPPFEAIELPVARLWGG